MEKLLIPLLFIIVIFTAAFIQPDGPLAVLFGTFCALIAVFFINNNFNDKEKNLLRNIFLIGLLLRVGLAIATYVYGLQEFFGGDSITYDNAGYALYSSWFGNTAEVNQRYVDMATKGSGSGFGMFYIVAAVYTIVGRNPLAIQFLNCVLGAATACLIYVCAKNIFNNNRVAKTSAIFVAVFPSLITWTSQGLKDGIICFFLALAINALFSLRKSLNYGNVLLLLLALVGIYSLRFYIFFAFAVAILGSFVIGTQKSVASTVRQVCILVVISLGLTYIGVLRGAQENIERYGNLETLQNSRLDQARSAQSGYGQDIDVSTPAGAIEVLPLGLTYLMLAPFPWQIGNLRQAITLPEVFVWWALIPFLITGLWFTLKTKLRESIAILLLTLLLTISYAIFQSNVGTAYRMRAQMQIFYFIFIAAGLVIWKEKRENRTAFAKGGNKMRMLG